MELDFDKEIDALLRQTARSGDSVSKQTAAHLDADEISAFAENALPEKTRLKYVLHLADCERCRKNVSNLISLNADAPSEIVHANEEKPLVAAPISWYRKLFAVPNTAYAMGALVLLFSGIAVYTILKSGDSQNSQVSGVYEKQIGGKGMSSDGDAGSVETYSNKAMSNTMVATNTTANISMNSASSASNSIVATPMSAANSNMTTVRKEADKDLNLAAKPAEARSEPTDAAKTADSVAPPAPPAPVKESQTENELTKQQPNIAQQQNQTTQNQTQIMPDSRNAQRAPSGMLRAENKAKKLEEARDDAREKSAETTIVGGKIFSRQNGVSVDSAYRGQATTIITRGTKEYKKLDKDLRRIVENLGGTVVIVWKEKAYRIQ